MSRNLLRRVEVVAPIEDRSCREKLWETLQINIDDNRLAWDMGPDGEYKQRQSSKTSAAGSQDLLMNLTKQRGEIYPHPKKKF
jgi:polyphosphate kinase